MLSCLFFPPAFLPAAVTDEQVAEAIEKNLSIVDLESASAMDQRFLANLHLNTFYAARNFKPAWIENGQPKGEIEDLLNALSQSDREGLIPANYQIAEIIRMEKAFPNFTKKRARDAAHFDLLLTHSYLTYASDLVFGRINPADVDDDWFAKGRYADLLESLTRALETESVRQTLQELYPKLPMYQRLRSALVKYRLLASKKTFMVVEDGKVLHKGDTDPRVPTIRERLISEGDLNQLWHDGPLFDGAMVRALKHFQRRNGLEPDGVFGATSVEALNISPTARIEQIRVNMERCRWLPADLGARHIFVNIPGFDLQVVEDGESVLEMKVVVGRKMRQTPVFSSTMTYMVLNPKWTVPVKVAREDILNHIREEPDYLTKNGFDVFESYESNAKTIDPVTINWSSYTAKNLPFQFRQKPGAANALGRIKFLFPNKFDVYLHDTPSRSLFSKTVRDFSSGCIRLEKPIDLAAYLMQTNPAWPKSELLKMLDRGNEYVLYLPEGMRVHLMYMTAWVDNYAVIQFRNDIYERDAPVAQALNKEVSLP